MPGRPWMPAPVAVLVEVDGEPVAQAYIAHCAICRGPCRGAHSGSLMLGKLPLALYGAAFQLLEGTLVSYTPPQLFACC